MAIPGASLLGDVSDVIAAAANPYGLVARDEWTITNGSFKALSGDTTEITFYVADPRKKKSDQQTALESIQDSGGRRVAIYEYPYKDGQDVDDLGRKGGKWVFNLLFYGKNYRTMADLFDQVVVQNNSSGILIHPTKGQMIAHLTDFTRISSYDKFSAVAYSVTFVEDNAAAIQLENTTPVSTNSAIRSALSFLTQSQSTISNALFVVTALLKLPAAIQHAMSLKLSSIVGQFQRLLGQIAATFSTDAQLKALASQTGSFLQSSIGTTVIGTVLSSFFQVGTTPEEQALVDANQEAFTNAQQITPQALVYQTNQIRSQIADAIAEVEANTGSDGFSITQSYRELAVEFQYAVESAIASAQSTIVYYRVPYPMSVRTVAKLNGLNFDRGNEIAQLNSEIQSLNYIPANTILAVPAA